MNRKIILPVVLLLLWTTPAFSEEPSLTRDEKPTKTALAGEVITLSQGLRLVTQENRTIKITRGDEAIAEADVLKARSPLLPSVNGSLSNTSLAYEPAAIFSTPAGTLTVPTSQRDFYSYGMAIQQTLFDFWGNSSRYGASKMVLETKKLDTQRVRNLVALDFTLTYFDLLESEKVVAVAEAEVERLEVHLRDAKRLYAGGVITRNDLLQAEVRLADARQRLLTARNQRAVQISRLNNLLLRPLLARTRVVEEKEALPGPLALDIEAAWARALKERPEIQIAEGTLKALKLDEIAKKSDYYPKIFARGGYDYTQNRYVVHEGNWSLIFGMNVNLFSGGSTRADVLKSQSQQYQLLEQRAKLLDDIRLEVQKYMLDLENAGERIQVTQDAMAQAKENLRINRVRYEEGVGTATEVLDAVNLLTVSETNYNRAIYDYRRAEAGVYYAMGVDLREVYH
jgi:outer membrane protein TolC